MKSLKIKIPAFLGAIMILIISNGIEENIVKYCLWSISVVIGLWLASLITKDIIGLVLSSKENKKNELDRLTAEFNESIKKYTSEQNDNTKALICLMEQFNKATEQYMERLEVFIRIQNTIIEEGKKLVGEVQAVNGNIHKLLKEFCSEIDNRLSSLILSIDTFNQEEKKLITDTIDSICSQNAKHEDNMEKILSTGIDEVNKNTTNVGKTIENTLEDFCSDFSELQTKAHEKEAENLLNISTAISEYMTEYEEILGETKDSLNALKAQVRVSMEQINKAMQEQTESIEEGFGDCTDEIGEKLEEFRKEQKTRDDEQNTKLNEEVKAIENIVSSKIEQALEENEKLIKYIQKVQEEWTTLSKDEIEFLNKVWNE